jgi:hypothetical protein
MFKVEIPNWLIILGAIGQMFTAIIYPYIRHVVFDWFNDIKKLKPLNQEIAKTYGRYSQGLNFSFGLISILFTQNLKKQNRISSCFNWTYCCLLDRESSYAIFILSNVRDTQKSYI